MLPSRGRPDLKAAARLMVPVVLEAISTMNQQPQGAEPDAGSGQLERVASD